MPDNILHFGNLRYHLDISVGRNPTLFVTYDEAEQLCSHGANSLTQLYQLHKPDKNVQKRQQTLT